jgi:cytochrome c peroxidase
VPTLRTARTAPYFRNGAFATLREAADFYARRDTQPGDCSRIQPWRPKFDDLARAGGSEHD